MTAALFSFVGSQLGVVTIDPDQFLTAFTD